MEAESWLSCHGRSRSISSCGRFHIPAYSAALLSPCLPGRDEVHGQPADGGYPVSLRDLQGLLHRQSEQSERTVLRLQPDFLLRCRSHELGSCEWHHRRNHADNAESYGNSDPCANHGHAGSLLPEVLHVTEMAQTFIFDVK